MNIDLKQGMSLLKVVNKMGIKQDIISKLREISKVEINSKKAYSELLNFVVEGEEVTNELTEKLLNEHLDIAEKLQNAREDQVSIVLELVFTILEKIPSAETEFYKALSTIYELKENEVKALDLGDVAEKLKEIIFSESFIKLFTLVQK
ncbi:hypothetical protein [Clostridium sp. C8-1-8]|uniref:hypothetical protein n=1 Tax=Clostridium sp. C8-1-8 TaxID=2698831 RepID=UPI00137145AD|nr:hypothetical protein [Clostridium sp. C8-1-8]